VRKEILASAGIERAKVVVFEISDSAAVVLSVKAARELAPETEILVRTRKFTEIFADGFESGDWSQWSAAVP